MFCGGKGQHCEFSPLSLIMRDGCRSRCDLKAGGKLLPNINIPEAVTRYQQIFAQKYHLHKRPRDAGVCVHSIISIIIFAKFYSQPEGGKRSLSLFSSALLFSRSTEIFFKTRRLTIWYLMDSDRHHRVLLDRNIKLQISCHKQV